MDNASGSAATCTVTATKASDGNYASATSAPLIGHFKWNRDRNDQQPGADLHGIATAGDGNDGAGGPGLL